MNVNNVRLYAKHLRRDLGENSAGLPEPAHKRFLLQGANGSGKSTLLDAICSLWDFFGEWIDVGPGRSISGRSRSLKHYFAHSDLAAMEIKGLLPDGQSLWIGMGKVKYWVDLKDEHPDGQFAGLVQNQGSWEVQLPPGDWQAIRRESLVGASPQPNIVYFPPECRTLAQLTTKTLPLIDLMSVRWLAAYGQVPLEALLLTVKAHSRRQYDEAIELTNYALDKRRKMLEETGSQRLIVRGKAEFGGSYEHALTELSSGEKQMLLLIGFVACTLQNGGIVVIDEPDLHIHISMITQLLQTVDKVVHEKSGQLIVASHSEWVWNWFSRDSERIELTPWRRDSQ